MTSRAVGVSFAASAPFILAALYIDKVKGAFKAVQYRWFKKIPLTIREWLARCGLFSVALYDWQRDVYKSLVDHSSFYEDYIHHIIAEEQYDSDDLTEGEYFSDA